MNKSAEKAQLTIAKVIRIVVLISAAIILFGLILYLVSGASGYAGDIYPTDPLMILSGVLSLKPFAVMMTGLFILILTPILRVGMSIIVFIREKDKLYIIITSAVFIILIVSQVLGKVE